MDFLAASAYDIGLSRSMLPVRALGLPPMDRKMISVDRKLTLLTSKEAADYLRVSLSTLHRMERNGRLRPLRTPGGHRRYTLAMLNKCLATDKDEVARG